MGLTLVIGVSTRRGPRRSEIIQRLVGFRVTVTLFTEYVKKDPVQSQVSQKSIEHTWKM